jgi:dTDP-4-amino-4,6-dideoxygalactose transaminase
VFIDPKRFGLDRDAVVEIMALENLHVRKYFEMPCHHMAAYAGEARESLPNSETMGYNVISLPVYNDMTMDECDLFIEALGQIHRNAAEISKRLEERGGP